MFRRTLMLLHRPTSQNQSRTRNAIIAEKLRKQKLDEQRLKRDKLKEIDGMDDIVRRAYRELDEERRAREMSMDLHSLRQMERRKGKDSNKEDYFLDAHEKSMQSELFKEDTIRKKGLHQQKKQLRSENSKVIEEDGGAPSFGVPFDPFGSIIKDEPTFDDEPNTKTSRTPSSQPPNKFKGPRRDD
eukprot:TRINITY_DN1350_c0_g2_i1.p1 TRINITY_DN1350_c0_g2~~TRINITY_DN1350_c0_g2_i1.p1  ORF type:complete len:186 (-),score=30.64 TRINITY_DN1350_c0_g2_i1:224-781(-)